MKVMLTAFTASLLIAFGANLVLNEIGFSSQNQTSGAAVRLGGLE